MENPLLRDLWRTLKREPYAESDELLRYSLSGYLQQIHSYNGSLYQAMPSYSLGGKQEEPDASFEGYVSGLYKSNAVVFACMDVRLKLFSQARFQFRQMRGGRPGDLFGTPELSILEVPWQNATTGDLLVRAIQDADIAGNFYAVRQGGEIRRLRPDWVSIVLGTRMAEFDDEPWVAPDVQVAGYLFHPGGYNGKHDPISFLAEHVCHFAPVPDPLARFRGMSWLTPVIREVMGDNAATGHKLTYFEKGATPNMAVKLDPQFTPAQVETFAASFREKHRDVADAYRTMFLGGGATIDVIGANLQEVDFKSVQGGGETRIAAAAGVPPVIAGLSEGLAAATYSNYQQSIRRFTDLTMIPLWGNMAGSLASIISEPPQSDLWFDDRDIPALREDAKDLASIQMNQATTMKTLVDGGWEPDAIVDAVMAADLARLKGSHTGLNSVQLQPPGTTAPEPSTNGALPIGVDV